MSALVPSTEGRAGGVPRYRTRWKIIIHSHRSDVPITLQDKVITVSTNKTVKNVGTCSLSFTADVNLLNKVFPDDYINVYVDRGEGSGWTRLFFGFVDHIEEVHRVDATGVPQTIYSLQCSDFQKALEKTQIYFNPHVAARADFSGGFVGTVNLGGVFLRSIGILLNGSPADFVANVILLLMGFGGQFVLPSSYNPRLMDRIRAQRASFVLDRLPEDVKRSVLEAGGYTQFLERVRAAVVPESSLTAADFSRGFDPASANPTEVQRAQRARLQESMIRRLSGAGVADEGTDFAREVGAAAFNILNTTATGYPPCLLDVIDIFTFLERGAIDGYCAGAPLAERQGTVMNFLRFVSNEVVNEMFFDLRPISKNGGLVAGTDFSTDPDDVNGNVADEDTPAGILYQPALVMREYPFSTIQSIDMSQFPLTVRERPTDSLGNPGPAQQGDLEYIGHLHFGAIYSNEPNVPGRHVVTVPNMNLEDRVRGIATSNAPKHLDVVVVRDKEIMATRFSRSDNDHFNLFEFTSDSMIGNAARWFMQDICPIITPIHIAQHGLRVRSLETRFTRTPLPLAARMENRPANTADATGDTSAAEEAAPTASATVLPVELVGEGGRYTQGYVGPNNRWHYRSNSASGVRRVNSVATNPIVPQDTQMWVFHNGVDIRARRNTPVRAVRDGLVVAAIPEAVSRTYGNVVIIYHEQDDLFSLYAHLERFADGIGSGSSGRQLIRHVSTHVKAGGRYEPQRVKAGDVIGFVGDSGSPVRRNRAGEQVAGGVHLHFEFGKKRNGVIYPSSSQRTSLTPDYFKEDVLLDGRLASSYGFPISADRPPNPDESQTISQDPIRVFAEFGVTLPVGTAIVEEEIAEDATAEAQEPERAVAAPPEDEESGSQAQQDVLSGAVDTPTARRLLARWSLLQDHWYQHNLEYLDGTIDMRGAPEIRVGYRLDLPDRNLSAYIEGVSHNWSFGSPMVTTLHVTRGQPSNPYPAYVMPVLGGFRPTDTQRRTGSRLSHYFIAPDPISVRRSLAINGSSNSLGVLPKDPAQLENTTDMADPGGTLASKYNEEIIEANMAGSVPMQLTWEEIEAAEREQQASLAAAPATPPTPLSEEDLAFVDSTIADAVER